MTDMHSQRRRALRVATETLAAAAALALLTVGAYALHIRSGPAGVVYFCLVVLASLRGSLPPALLVAIGGTAAWDYFFTGAEVTRSERNLRYVVTLAAFCAVAILITRLVRARRESLEIIRRNEARDRWQASLLDLTHDAIFVRDLNDVLIYWNRGAEQLYGWSSTEAVGRVTHELLRTEFPEPLPEIRATLLRTGRWDGELVHTKRDGTRAVMASRWSLQRDAEGRPAGILATNNDITEQKRAESELHRGHSYMAEAQRLSHTGSFAWRASDNSLSWSDETYRIYGLDRATRPTVERVLDRVHPEDRSTVGQVIVDSRRNAKDFDLDHRLLMPDGSVRHLHAVAKAVADETGQLQFVGVVVDITNEKAAEEQRLAYVWFLESMDRINRAIQGTNDIEQMMSDVLDVALSIFAVDRVWLLYPCNADAPSWRIVMARTRPECPISIFQGPEGTPSYDDIRPAFRAARATASAVQLNATSDPPLPDHAMKLTGVQSAMITALYPKVREPWLFGFSQCSHARVWTEPEERLFQEIGRRLSDALTTLLAVGDLRESARRYQNIFQTAAVSICEQDCSAVRTALDELRAGGVQDFRRWFAEHPDFVAQAIRMIRIVDVNDATVTLFGARSKDELVESAHKVLVPETMPLLVEELLAIAEHRTSFAAEARLQTLSGDQLDVLFMVAFPPEPTTLDSVLVSLMDVTARKQAEEALRTAHAELARASTLTTMGQLAASIAHELRQPLAAISMNASAALRWLKRGTPDLPEATDATTRIVQDAHRADEVIRGLRGVMGQSALQREAIDATDAVQHVLQLVRGELRRNDVTVQLDLAPALPPVLGDRIQLQQVLLNLIMNAIEAMEPVSERPKSVVIRSERGETGEVAVIVDDTGPGLEPTTAERIFDPFFTTKPNGLGMGLSICRSIVEAHGGHLSASPRSPHGTTFRFTVPTIRPPLDELAAATERGAAAP